MSPEADGGPSILASYNNDGSEISWMETNWMFVAWAGALGGLGILISRINHRGPFWYGWLALVMYLFHQTEEHGYDLRGWRYSFVPYVNSIFGFLCDASVRHCPLDPKMAMYVNTVMIWVGFSSSMIAAHVNPEMYHLAPSFNWGTSVVNGLTHFVVALKTLSYNPGLGQSMVMVPMGLFIIRSSCSHPWLCILNGVGAHVIGFAVGLNVLYGFSLPETPTIIFFSFVSSVVLPLGLARNFASKVTSRRRDYNAI